VHTLPLPEVTDNKQNTKSENGNSKLDRAQMAPQASNFDLRVSVNSLHLTPQQLQFLLRVTPAALESQRAYEIPASVTIAQAILESATPKFGWGSSVLFRVANNPFGIKYCHFGSGNRVTGGSAEQNDRAIGISGEQGGADPKFQIPNSGSPAPSAQNPAPKPEEYGHFDAPTWEVENGQKKVVVAPFQRFPNLHDAFTAHALLLRGPRYRPAFAVRGDWKQFAERLGPKTSRLDTEHCGYSTNPSYSAELIKLVNLYRLNDLRALEWYATGQDPGAEVSRQETADGGPGNPQLRIFCDPEIGQ
jgi:flagellum-specific peptidoglycan hydrolase FlgJ